MARRGALGGFSLDLFGGGGVDASVFNIASQSRQNEAYLALTRVEVQWEAGRVSNADYLAALRVYVDTFPADSAERLNQESRLESTTYRIERNVIAAQVEAGSKTKSDLLAYDRSKLDGLNPDSQEYLDRLNRVQSSENAVFSEEEEDQAEAYQAGKITTTQLKDWYASARRDPRFSDNPDLLKAVDDRLVELADRVVDERDSKMISDFSSGKVAPTTFLAYATAARARYKAGTTQAEDWDARIESAKDSAIETDLAYRYGLSQDYLKLQQFVKSNSGSPGGSTSTSSSKRTILGEDGKWKVVTVTSSKSSAPSAGAQKAYRDRQIEVAAAKEQMRQIERKIANLPGGFIQTAEMITFYKKQLGTVARGTQEWYAIQGKIDSLNDAASNERVLSRQGIKISYPKVSSEKKETFGVPGAPKAPALGSGSSKPAAKPASASNVEMEDFLKALAHVESGGRYDARNKQSGAYGKYQILPSNWSSYAQRAGLPADAQPTPENQERVAKAAFERYYKKYDGDWAKMAAAWHAGVAGSAGAWGPRTRAYVSKVLGTAGISYNGGRTATSAVPSSPASKTAATSGGAKPASGGGARPAASGGAKPDRPVLKAFTSEDVSYSKREVGYTDWRSRELSYGLQTVDTTDVEFPKGLDARQFRKVYAAIEAAFNRGDQAATITLGTGKTMHVFIGDDPDEQIALMRELDDMRVDLADAEARAYKGTASESTKSQAQVTARKEAAGHELLILGREGGPLSKDPPVTAAVRAIEKIQSGVATEVDLMNDAYARGDLTEAYLHSQRIDNLVNGDTKDGRRLASLVDEVRARITAVQQATGLSVKTVLGGSGPAGTELLSDLETIENAAALIGKAAEAGEETAVLLNNQLQRDPSGQVKFTTSGPRGEVVLKPDFIKVVTPSGKVDVIPTKGRNVREDGSIGAAVPEGMVKTLIKTGNGITDAYAGYTVDTVGYAMLSDGVTKVPIKGKIVTLPVDRNNDGTFDGTSAFFENPLTPGKWSSTPIMYKAPPGAKTVYGKTAEPAFSVDVGNGDTITLELDPKTGVYVAWKEHKGSGMPWDPPTEPVQLGTADQSLEVAALMKQWSRDLSGVADSDKILANIEAPAPGFSPEDWTQLKKTAESQTAEGMRKALRASGQAGATPMINPTTGFTMGFRDISPEQLAAKAAFSDALKYDTGSEKTMAGKAKLATLKPLNTPTVNAQTGFTTGQTTSDPDAPTSRVRSGSFAAPKAKPKDAPPFDQEPARRRARIVRKTKIKPLPVKKVASATTRVAS